MLTPDSELDALEEWEARWGSFCSPCERNELEQMAVDLARQLREAREWIRRLCGAIDEWPDTYAPGVNSATARCARDTCLPEHQE